MECIPERIARENQLKKWRSKSKLLYQKNKDAYSLKRIAYYYIKKIKASRHKFGCLEDCIDMTVIWSKRLGLRTYIYQIIGQYIELSGPLDIWKNGLREEQQDII